MHIALIEEANHIFRRISKELRGKTYDSRKTISADLPFAQNRWCEAAGLEQVQIFSDHINMSFGTAYGTYMKEYRLECRAVFVVDEKSIVQYVEYVQEVTKHPNYEAALEAVKSIFLIVKK